VNKQTGRYEQAHTHYLAALEHATAARHRRLVAAAHVNLGGLLVNQGDPTGAVRHLRTALADPDYGGEPAYATVTYLNYGCALLELGVPDEATRALTEAMSLATRANDPLNACHAHHGLAELHLRTGDLPTAVHHAQQELDLAIRMGDPLRHAAALDILASCLAPDDLDAARHRWSEALEIYRSLDHRLQYPLHHWLDGLDNAAAATDFAQRDAVRRGRARKMI